MCAFSFLKRFVLAVALTAGFVSLAPSVQAQFVPPGGGNVNTNFTATNIIHFKATNYFASEDGIQVLITVVRDGPITNTDFISIDFTMQDGTAISGINYYKQSGTLAFFPGVAQTQFAVPLIDNSSANGDVFLNLILRNPTSGTTTKAVLGEPSTAILTIIDDESATVASSAGSVEIAPGNSGSDWRSIGVAENGSYLVNREEWNVDTAPDEANFKPYGPGGAEITIVRKGGSKGRILVDWRTTTNVVPIYGFFFGIDIFGNIISLGGGLATPGEDFIATNGTVVMDDYQMSEKVLLPLPATKDPEQWRFLNRAVTNQFVPPVTFGVELTAVRAAPEETNLNINPTLGTSIQRRISISSAAEGFGFTRQHYVVREGQRYCRVRVRRSIASFDTPFGGVHVHYAINPRRIVTDSHGGDFEGNLFPLVPGSDYTTPFIDYEPPGSDQWMGTVVTNNLGPGPGKANWVDPENEATITWPDNDVTDRYILVPIADDNEAEFNEDMEVVLWKHAGETDGYINAFAGVCTITVVDNDQPAGASDVKFNPDFDPLTDPPYMANPGANNTVQAVAAQPDGKVLLGGDFTAVNTLPRNKIARLNFDGSTDKTFTPGTGVSGFVRALATEPDGRILVAGGFDAYNGISRVNIARLLTNGVLDATFNPGIGTDGPIRAVAVQPDGKIIIGGDFNSYNGTNINYVARLNVDGTLDTTFNTGSGPDGPVNSVAVTGAPIEFDQTETGGPAEEHFVLDTGSTSGMITINYDFFTTPDSLRIYYGGVNGGLAIFDSGVVSSNGVITVNYPPAGTPPTSTLIEIVMNENNPLGYNLGDAVWFYHLRVDPDQDPRPVIGGEFSNFNGVPINNIARLNTDGSLDRSFDPGSGTDDRIYAVAKQGNEVIMAGDFHTVNLQDRRGIARLNEDGSLDQLFDPGTGFDNSVFSLMIQPTGKPVLGGPFRSFNQTRRVGIARLNRDGSLDTSFMDTAKNQFAGIPTPLSPENPESQENFVRSMANYRFTNYTYLTNFVVDTNNVTNAVISTNILATDNVFIGGHFSNPGGGFNREERRPRNNLARLIGGATPGPGNISFLQDAYSVNEDAGSTFITLTRTNGSLAPISARFDAKDFPNIGPGLATGGLDYQVTTNFPLWVRSYDGDRQYSDAYMGPNFNAFTTNRPRTDYTLYTFPNRPGLRYRNNGEDNVFVSIFDDNVIEGDEVVNLSLSAPDEGKLLLGGQPIPVGTALGKAHATLTIADNDFDFGTLGFSDPEYFVNENELKATINVTRVGGSSGPVTVDVYTQDGTANSSDYVGIPKLLPNTLSFDSGQTNKTFTITIKNDTLAELEETVLLFLTNATGFPANVPLATRLDPARSTAVLNIIDDDFLQGRLSFTAASYNISEGAGEVTVTVRRSGGNSGDVGVNFQTQNGSARAGIDYVSTNGILRWTDRDSSAKSFTVPIINNDIVEGDKTFNIILSNPTITGALGAQPTTVVHIQNDDSAGTFSFSQATYDVDENGPYADITVLRQNGISGAVSVRFAATDGTAVGTTNSAATSTTTGVPDYIFPEYVAANGFTNILHFVQGQTSASFRIPLIDDSILEGQKTVNLALFNAGGGATMGLTNAVLVIVDDEQNRIPAGSLDTEFTAKGADDYVYSVALQPDGKIVVGGDFRFMNDVARNRLARLDPAGVLDPSFIATASPNDSVRTIAVEAIDSRLFIGGLFSSLGSTNRNHLARLNSDGQADPTFDPGSGTDNPIFSLVEQPDGNVIIIGNFTTYRLISRRGIARVSTNGVLDTSFNPGTGANDTIWAVALQNDGKILVGGDFTTFNEIPRNRIARLNHDGSVDRTFGEGTPGSDGSVRTIVVQTDANILIGGLFTNVNGKVFNRIARLRATGSTPGALDDTFTLGAADDLSRATNGANGAVNVIALQLDGKILVGGDFTQFDGRTRNRITRLNSDGSIDPTINFGAGANGPISAIVVQPDRKILIGGGFTTYDTTPAQHLARIFGGALSGSGQLQFTDPFPSASETDANAIVNIRRTGGTTGPLTVDFVTLTNDTAVAGQDFRPVTNTIQFPEAETFRSVLVPLIRNTNALEDRFIEVILTNLVGNGSLGSQPRARITIVNSDSLVQFSRASYSVAEDFAPGAATITVQRVGSTSQPLSVDFLTQDDTATAGADYGAVNTTITFAPGEASRTVAVPIFDDTLVEGDERISLILTNLVGLGTISTNTATLTIVDNDFSPGQIEFTASSYAGLEGSRQIVVRLHRVGGTTGVISVEYATEPGGDNPASTPSDYTPSSGIVSFSDGVVDQSFIIPVVDDQLVEGNETFLIVLSNPRGGTSISGPDTATGIIVDDDLPSGSLDRTFDPGTGANGEVRTVKLDQNNLIMIGGDFTGFNGVNRSHIARLNTDAGVDPAFDPGAGPDATVAAINIDPDGRFTIGGQFNTIRGLFLNRVARLRADASPDPSFALPLGLNAEVSEVVRQPDGKVLIGGTFDVVDAAILNHIARLNSDGTVDIGFNPGGGTDGNVTAIALQQDGKVLVGGAFSRLDGVFKSGVVRVNSNGAVDTAFNPNAAGATGGGVEDILILANGQIIIAGDFTAYNGIPRSRVARLNADGSLDATFDPGAGPNRIVYAIGRQSDDKLIIVGDFTTVAGVNRSRIARLNTDGSHDTDFKPGAGANDAILAVAIQPNDGRILIGGRFTTVDSEPRAHIARLNNDKSFIQLQDVAFAPVVKVGDKLQLTVSTQVGFSYTLESSTTLSGSWKTEQTIVAQSSSTVFEVTPSEAHQFYRVRRD